MSARFVACAATALFCASAMTALAAQTAVPPTSSPTVAPATPQPSPTPVNLPSLPPATHVDPYTRAAIDLLTGVVNRAISNIGNTTSGQVTYFKRYDMQIQTGGNAYRSIRLHQGTVINPRGATITLGRQVDGSGIAQSDGTLEANVITLR